MKQDKRSDLDVAKGMLITGLLSIIFWIGVLYIYQLYFK